MWAYIGVILISFLISGFFAKYIIATAAEKAESAAIYDLLLMLASSCTYQIWYIQQGKFPLLIVGDVAAAVGTYVFVKWTKAHRSTKKSPKKKQGWVVNNLNKIFGAD